VVYEREGKGKREKGKVKRKGRVGFSCRNPLKVGWASGSRVGFSPPVHKA